MAFATGWSVPKCAFAIGISRCARECLLIPKLSPPALFLLRRFVVENRLIAESQEAAGATGRILGPRSRGKTASHLFRCGTLRNGGTDPPERSYPQIVAT